MNLFKKNLLAIYQKDKYNMPKKNIVIFLLGIVWVIALWFICQTLPTLIVHVADNSKELSPNVSYLLMALGNCIAAFVTWFFFIRKNKKHCPRVIKKMSKIECGSGLFFHLAVSGLISIIVDLIKSTGLFSTAAAVENLVTASIWVQILLSVFSAAIAEELLLRECIQNRFMARFNSVWAIIIPGIIFGIIHGNISQLITAGVSGIVYCFIYAKTRSLTTVILAHMLNNLVALLQANYVTNDPTKPAYWICTIIIVLASAVLSVPFIKGEAAEIDNAEA